MRGEIGGRDDLGVAIVTMGRPEEAAAFCRDERLPFACLSDRARDAYRAYGLRRGSTVDMMRPEAMVGYARAATKGYFPGAPVGDVYQLGGAFLIGTDGRIAYAHYPRHPADHPPAGAITRAADRMGRAGP